MARGYLATMFFQRNYAMHGPIFQMATSLATPNLLLESTSKNSYAQSQEKKLTLWIAHKRIRGSLQ